MTVPSAYVVVGAALIARPASRSAGVRSRSPLAMPGSRACCCSSVPAAASTSAPQQSVSQTGRCFARVPVSRSSTLTSGSPSPSPPYASGHGEPEQPGLGELGPAAVAVEHVGQHRADRRQRLGALGVHLREAVSRHVQNCNVF